MPRYTPLSSAFQRKHCPHSKVFFLYQAHALTPDVSSQPFMPLPVIFLFLCLSVLRGQQVVALPGRPRRTYPRCHSPRPRPQRRCSAPSPQQLRRLFHAVLLHVRGYRLPVHRLENVLKRRRVHKVFVRKLLNGDALPSGWASSSSCMRRAVSTCSTENPSTLCPAASPSPPRAGYLHDALCHLMQQLRSIVSAAL